MAHHRRGDLPALRLSVILGLFCLALGVVPAGLAQAPTPSLLVAPSSAPPGTTLDLQGAGFPLATPGVVLWIPGDAAVATFTTDDTGAFTAAVAVPDVAPDVYSLVAIAGEGERAVRAEALLTVEEVVVPTPPPTDVLPAPSTEVPPGLPTLPPPPTAPPTYPIVASGQSATSPPAAVVHDGDPATAWIVDSPNTPDAAWLWLDLGQARPIASVRWLLAAPGLLEGLELQLSEDGQVWASLVSLDGTVLQPGGWHEQPVDVWARYLRVVVHDTRGLSQLGGFGEIELWPAPDARPLAAIVTPEPLTATIESTVASSPTPVPAATPSPMSTSMPTPTVTPAPTATNTPVPTTTAPTTVAPPTPAPTEGLAPSQPQSIVAAAAGPLTFTPVADAYVAEANPTANFGSESTLLTDTSPNMETYIRFDVSGVSSTVESATLRLWVVDSATNGPPVSTSADTTWTESGITWDTRPAVANPTSDVGAVPENAWLEYDVTSLVAGDGAYTFALVPQSSNGLDVSSREAGSNQPQLVITTIGAGVPTPTATTTASTPAPAGNSSTSTMLQAVGGSNPSFSGARLPIVKGSSSAPSTSPSRAFDGSLGSSWYTTGGAPKSAALTLDLGRVQKLSGIKWTYGTADGVDTMRLELSANGTSWTHLSTTTVRTPGTWEGSATTARARYVRMVFDNPSGRPYLGIVAEVQAWGTNVITPGSNPSFSGSRLAIVKGTSSATSTSPTRAFDGSLSSNWYTTGAAPRSAALTLDLGQVRQLSGLKWTYGTSDGVDTMRLEVSANGTSWAHISTTTVRQPLTWEGSATSAQARYVRLVFANTTNRPHLGIVAEVQIWGTATLGSTTGTIVAAGDIAVCGSDNDEATARLVDGIPGEVLILGDNAYNSGTLANFNDCYHPTWGRHKARTHPIPGNHDYSGGSQGRGYYDYFNGVGVFSGPAGDRDKGYYSFNVGGWHIVAINSCAAKTTSDTTCTPGTAQLNWLKADLAANATACTLAYWHHPHFSSGHDKNNGGMMTAVFQALYDAGADVVMVGHSHDYERFAPQRPDGTKDTTFGIREFVIGTGGAPFTGSSSRVANSEVFNNTTYGVVKLSLRTNGYDWRFMPVAGQSFTDSGTASCHGKPSAERTEPGPVQLAQVMGLGVLALPLQPLLAGAVRAKATLLAVTYKLTARQARRARTHRAMPRRRRRGPDAAASDRSPPE